MFTCVFVNVGVYIYTICSYGNQKGTGGMVPLEIMSIEVPFLEYG